LYSGWSILSERRLNCEKLPMGICANWVSVAGLSKAEVLARLGLVEVGRSISLEGEWFGRGAHAGVAEWPSGRVLVLCNQDWFGPAVAAEVSAGAELVMCFMEEHVMVSSAYGFRDGHQLWRIDHNPEGKKVDDEAEGDLPPAYEAAMAEAAQLDRDQGGADYFFSVPCAVAGAVGGYRPDEELPGFDYVFSVVESKAVLERSAELESEEAAWKASGGWVGAVRRLFGR
jgi:hypothetical protein